MKETFRLPLTLALVCAACSFVLTCVHLKTREPIRQASRAKAFAAARAVLPSGCEVSESGGVFKASKGGKVAGYATLGRSSAGYGGELVLMVGIGSDGRLLGYSVVSSKETPGLGSQVGGESFRGQFTGQLAGGGTVDGWKVRQDGGAFDAVTAATISSRAAIEAIGDAVHRIEDAARVR